MYHVSMEEKISKDNPHNRMKLKISNAYHSQNYKSIQKII